MHRRIDREAEECILFSEHNIKFPSLLQSPDFGSAPTFPNINKAKPTPAACSHLLYEDCNKD